MNLRLIQIGKTDQPFIEEGIRQYLSRISHYIRLEVITLPDIRGAKNLTREQQKSREGELILKHTEESDALVLLDESGVGFSSVEFSGWMQKKMNAGTRRLVFAIGGPYGFSREVYTRSNERISLSKMTFSHQMVRMIFLEQVYRAFTILNNEPYHHR